MPKAIAFFPWVFTDDLIEVGNLRLLPYKRGSKPGNLTHVSQKEIDGVLSAYAVRPNKLIKKAAILELGNWQSGMDADSLVSGFFEARNAIAFSALSRRRLFAGHFDYCNFDSYSLVVQNFQADSVGTFSFSTRRRDGGTNQIWSSDEFAFHQPHHVAQSDPIKLDNPLLQVILSLDESHQYLIEAANEFCSANTDSSNVPEHVEIVMMKSAFEWLLGIGQNAKEFCDALFSLINDIEPPPDTGPLKDNWLTSRPKATRPLEAWAREFCDIRGSSAHGKQRGGDRFVWSHHAHLAFCSLLFPLAFKKVLANEGLFQMNGYDNARLKGIEQYLMHNPFDFDWRSGKSSHPWLEIDEQARFQSFSLDLG